MEFIVGVFFSMMIGIGIALVYHVMMWIFDSLVGSRGPDNNRETASMKSHSTHKAKQQSEVEVNFWQNIAIEEKQKSQKIQQDLQRERARSSRIEDELRRSREKLKDVEAKFHAYSQVKYSPQTEKNITQYAKVLGLQGQFTFTEVKARYKKLSAQYHPDKVANLGEKLKKVANEEMKKINQAYAFFCEMKDARKE